MKPGEACPKREDLAHDLEYVEAYMAWRKKDLEGRKEPKFQPTHVETDAAQPVFEQGENTSVNSV